MRMPAEAVVVAESQLPHIETISVRRNMKRIED